MTEWLVTIRKGSKTVEIRWSSESADPRQLKRAVHLLTPEHARTLGAGIGDTVALRGWPVNEDGEPLRGVDEVAVEIEGTVVARAKVVAK